MDGMACRVLYGESTPKRLVGRFAHDLNALSSQSGVCLIGIIHIPPQLGSLENGSIFPLAKSKGGSIAHGLLELDEIGCLVFHLKAQLLSVKCTRFLDIGHM